MGSISTEAGEGGQEFPGRSVKNTDLMAQIPLTIIPIPSSVRMGAA